MGKGRSVFESVISSIPRVRKAGEQPQESLSSFDVFECDLCKGYVGRKELIQCPYCGRWVCRESCWEKDERACTSCSSVLRFGRETAGKAAPLDTHDEGEKGAEKEGVGTKLKGAVDRLKR